MDILGSEIKCKAKGQEDSYYKGKGDDKDCVFPFINKGKKFKGCAPCDEGKGHYCATKVDSKGNMVKDQWARCNEVCKVDCEGIFSHF